MSSNLHILLVDKDDGIFKREQAGWLERGTRLVLVDSMSGAIEKLFHSGVSFLFVSINADNIDWKPLMPVMREHSVIPIFLLAEQCPAPKKAEAFRAGADALFPLTDNVQDGIELALAYLQRLDARREQADRPLVWRDLVIDSAMHVAALKNNRLHLTPLGFTILRLLVLKRGRPMSKEAIYSLGWREDTCTDIDGVVASQIHLLREELRKYTDEEYIGNEWGIGYKII